MKNILYQLINYFELEQCKRWIKFVESPYFNTNKNLAIIAKEIVKYNAKNQEANLEKIYKKINGNKPYQSTFMHTNLARLLKLTEQFIEIDYDTQKKVIPLKLLDFVSNKIDISSHYFNKKKEYSLKKLDTDLKSNSEFFSIKHDLISYHKIRQNTEGIVANKGNIHSELDFAKQMIGLQQSNFYLKTLRASQNYILALLLEIEQYKPNLNGNKKQIHDYIMQHLSLEIQLLLKNKIHVELNDIGNISINLIKILSFFPNIHESYNNIIAIYNKKDISLDKNDAWNTLAILLQHGLKLYHVYQISEVPYYNYKILKSCIKNKLFDLEIICIPHLFRLTATLFFRFNDFEQAYQFIEENYEKIEQKHRLPSYYLCLLIGKFKEKEHEAAFNYLYKLNNVLISNLEMHYYCFHKQYGFQLYYETGNWAAAENLMSTFSTFLHRKKNNEAYQQLWFNFKNFAISLNKLRLDTKEEKVFMLKEKVEKEVFLSEENKLWLLEKIEELLH
ncbi:MAG: hypothetical protein ACPG5B_04910 [Chitinophagales bacterium]